MLRIISYSYLLFLLLRISPNHCNTHAEYLYPIGYDPNQQQFYLLYQSSLNQLKLWSWDPEIKTAFPATLSSFNPAAFQFLPDRSGFSFIDHGLVRVKNYDHRLVKTIELYAPLINLNSIKWQTPETFFFCAQSRNFYGIFKANLSQKIPHITTILWAENLDFLYPQVIGAQLFCIKRDPQAHAIIRTELLANSNSEPITLFSSSTTSGLNLKFLQMIDQSQGFFLAQVPIRNPEVISFDCYALRISENSSPTSKIQFLFSFDLPRAYFSTPSGLRLYESILPFLPRYTTEQIYFCSQDLSYASPSDLRVNIYSFDLPTSKLKQLTQASANQLFCGILILPNNQICYGGNALDITKANLTKSEIKQQLTHTTISIDLDDEWGLPKFELPLLKLSH